MSNSSNSFVHLHGHSHYSLLDGGATIEGLCKKTKELGMPALALTDHGNMFGTIDFYTTAVKAGIKPIIGCEFYVAPGSRLEKEAHGISEAAYHLVVLAKNLTGYKNMVKLASIAYLDGFYYRPRVDKEMLAKYHEGLVVINGHFGTEISALLEKNDLAGAVGCAGQYKDIFGEDFYVELQNHQSPEQLAMIPRLLEVAKKSGCPLVATNDHHYLLKDDFDAHEVLCCISMGKQITDETRLKYSRELYLKSPAEMRAIFKDLPQACDNTLKIAEACDVQLDFSKRHAPVYTPPADAKGKPPTPDEYLRELCIAGVKEKYGTMTPAIQERLDNELKVIQGKGFSSYFLIVWDFCNYAKQHGIPVGARGSGVGTLVGYVLSLCNVDPLRYDLLFERFMDPSRTEMPDIDIDICQIGRGRIIEYVRKKYGNVSQIITFNTLAAKAAIKDCGRVMGMPLAEVDKITKLIPNGPNVDLAGAVKIPDIKRMIEEQPAIARLFEIAKRLEGLCRNAGMHAAGVIVCDKPLDEVVPLYKNGDDIMTQWDGPTCEKMGLLKIDFLGLRTLTIVERALDLIQKDTGKRIDLEKIDMTDQKVYQQIFQRGQTKGVFQFESGGMKDLLMKMKPDRIEDLIAANALYRPGPMELIPDYCQRKHKKQAVPVVHPTMDKILEETYGIMVYQEQVMRIFNQLGNIPLAKAYKIIKAISKKTLDVIAAEKKNFVEGASQNGISKEQATELFALIEKFAGYGFNKSHSTRYAIIAFQTAWLKTYYPLQYMAALLTFEMVDQTKVVEYIDECRYLTLPDGKVGIAILPPDINQSDADFTVVGQTIRFGMAAVKGVGEKAVEAIIAARSAVPGPEGRSPVAPGGSPGSKDANTSKAPEGRHTTTPFKSLYDFCERVDLRVVNKSVIEALIKCGAFDSLHPIRAAAMAAVENATRMGQQFQEAARSGQESLFGAPSAGGAMPQMEMKLPNIPEWPKGEKMAFEKSVLGFYVTNHPLRDVERTFQSYITLDTQSIRTATDKQEGLLGGLIAKIRMMVTKSGPNAGSKWAILLIEDLAGSIEVVLYSNEYQKFAELIKPDAVIMMRGRVDRSREEPSFKATEIFTLEAAQKKLTREVLIQSSSIKLDEPTINRLHDLLKEHKGATPVKLELTDLAITPPVRVQVQLGNSINIQNGGLPALIQLFGESQVLTIGPNRRPKRAAPVEVAPPVAEPELIEV